MHTELLEKMKSDIYVRNAISAKYKKAQRSIRIFAIALMAYALLICVLLKFTFLGWAITWMAVAAIIAIPFYVLRRKTKTQRFFWGRIQRIEEDRETVPRKGSGAVFGTSHKHAVTEVYKLVVIVTDQSGAPHIIYCPAQYEKILQPGDTLLYHSALPYPAHLSNLTKCICMHCGTMQATEKHTCYECGADLYNHTTVQPQ